VLRAKKKFCWIRNGIDWEIQEEWLRREEKQIESSVKFNEEEKEWIEWQLQEWWEDGTMEEVTMERRKQEGDGLQHWLTLAPKSCPPEASNQEKWERKHRLCLAINKRWNDSLKARETKFKHQTIANIRNLLEIGDESMLIQLDLTLGYNHLLLNKSVRRFVRFCWKDRVFQMRVLFFGLSIASWAFSKIMIEAVGYLRMNGIRMAEFLDDWLINLRKIEAVEKRKYIRQDDPCWLKHFYL